MPRVRFSEDFDWKPTRRVTIAYRVGTEEMVTTPCAAAAIAAGKASKITRKREAKPHG